MTTIYDIARQTGYSPPTVSKALNGQGDVGQAARAKIRLAAEKLGYVPNLYAKSLKTKKTWLTGILFEETEQDIGMEHPLFAGIFNAFKSTMEASGYEMLFIARNLGRKRMSLLDHCRYRAMDGVLVLNCDPFDGEVLELVASGIPCVSANIVFPEVPTVTSENIESSASAVRYLHSLGHRIIGHIAGVIEGSASAGAERLEGYRQGLAACGLTYDSRYVVEARSWSMQGGCDSMTELAARGNLPSALFIGGDTLAFGAVRSCRRLGMEIPDDLSIISFDDTEWTALEHPSITTFHQDRIAIGCESARLLLRRIAGETVPQRVRVPVSLIERSSCRRMLSSGG